MMSYAELVLLAEQAATEHPRADVENLCRIIDVRYRTMYRAFNEVRGCPPLKAIRKLRLDAVRAELQSGKRPIIDVAIRHGFEELGRFAAYYRAEFGELPSQTLVRTRHSAFVPAEAAEIPVR